MIGNHARYIRHVKKILIGILVVGLSLGTLPAHADDVTIPGFADLNYSNPVKLKSSGCQELKFSYITDDNLARESTVFLVELVHKSKKIIYGGAVWFSAMTYKGPDALPSMSRIGNLKIKVCRKAWVMGSGSNQEKFPAVNPGTYRLYFAGGNMDPDTGAKSGDKVEVTKTLVLN